MDRSTFLQVFQQFGRNLTKLSEVFKEPLPLPEVMASISLAPADLTEDNLSTYATLIAATQPDIKAFIDKAYKIVDTKGRDYSDSRDCCDNFKRVGKCLGVCPSIVWAIYTHKHIDAVNSFVATGVVHSEPIEGRLLDLFNYFCLGAVLIHDIKQRT